MAGYSGTPLARKLGFREGMRACLVGAPRGYRASLAELPPGVVFRASARGPLDMVQFFTTRRRDLAARFPVLARALAPAGMLWVSWPKKAAKTDTDLTEDVVRGVGLAAGLVDVKVCAVDETWSGLKFVRRVRDRA